MFYSIFNPFFFFIIDFYFLVNSNVNLICSLLIESLISFNIFKDSYKLSQYGSNLVIDSGNVYKWVFI